MDRSGLDDEVVDPLIGTMIGRYRVERRIGQGGMGAVYEILQPAIRKRMALKLLHEEYAKRSEIVQRFFDEARAVNLIGHPCIVDITDFSTLPDGRPFIIMEYLQGETLEEYLGKNGPLSESEALEILQQICSALGAAHAKDIVHRDLKPENVFLVRTPHQPLRVKVLDFGIAKLKDKSTLEDVAETQTGVVLGTPTYMSPEQAKGNTLSADHRTDVYSLGAMLFQMLTGVPPFSGETFASLLFKHINEQPPSLDELRSDISPIWGVVVAKALAKAPDDRYQSVQALLADADGALPSPPLRATTAVPAPQSSGSSETRKARAPLAPLVAVGALFLVGGAFWLTREDDAGSSQGKQGGPTIIAAPSFDAAAPTKRMHSPALPSDAGAEAVPPGDASVPVRADAEPVPAEQQPKSRGTGTVRITADPWAHVVLDGKRVGQTPLTLTIASGRHSVRLRNENTGATRRHRFTLGKGKTHTIRERWD